jgi:ferrous iron transport protein A
LTLLADLPLGSSARVLTVTGDDQISLRLMEMGITPGVDVSIVGTAPFGDPLELDVRGYRLSVRRSEAARVQVETGSY